MDTQEEKQVASEAIHTFFFFFWVTRKMNNKNENMDHRPSKGWIAKEIKRSDSIQNCYPDG